MSINLGTLAEDGTRIITKAQLLSGFPGLGEPSIVSFFIQSGAGSLSSNGNGSWTYISAPNDNSAVEFAVTATDGSTTLSTTADLDLLPVNDAPVLTPISPHLTTITEDDADNPGQTVASIVGSSITDPDGPDVAKGIAVTGAQSANGHWEYSLNGGEDWTAFGAYSTSSALLLDQTNLVRFVPDGSNGGSSTFTYVAWDETVTFGTTTNVVPGGGITPYSIQSDTAHIAVTDVNDAPVLADIPAETSYTELAAPKTLAPGLSLTDVDNTTIASATVTITGGLTPGDVLSVGGATSGGSNGVTWNYDADLGVLTFTGEHPKSAYMALLSQVAFSSGSQDPTAMGANPERTIQWQVNDGVDASVVSTTTVTINAINDESIASTIDLGAIDEDTFRVITAAELLAGATDVDSASLSITSLSIQSGDGELVDNLDGTWSFTPAENDDTDVTFAFTVTDGENAVSSTATLDLTPVNDPPSVSLINFIGVLPENASTAQNVKLADIQIIDDDEGTNVLTLTGDDAFAFEIVGTELFLKAGTNLDFESKASYAIEVQVDDPTIITTLSVGAPKVGDTLQVGNISPELLLGTPKSDKLYGSIDVDIIKGLASSDIIKGGSGNDKIYGQTGNDKLFGDAGDDVLIGSAGNDKLYGGGSNDKLDGGRGRDIFKGAAGADVFDFNSIKDSVRGAKRDKLLDFKHNDVIDFRTIDAKTGAGNQKFKWIGKDDFTGKKGELRYDDKGAKVIVQGDVNGDGKADFEIFVKIGSLNAGDFLL